MNRAPKIKAKVAHNGGHFTVDSYFTDEATKTVGNLPYVRTKGTFGLFTSHSVTIGSVINDVWKVAASKVYACRCFCECFKMDYRNASEVKIVELTRKTGAQSQTVPKPVDTLCAGFSVASNTMGNQDQRKWKTGTVLFAMGDRGVSLIPGRHQVHHESGVYLVEEVIDQTRPDRMPVVVAVPDHERI